MSSFLPNVMVSQAVKELRHQDQRSSRTTLEKKIRAGLDRLYDFQHEDGGWGWWKTDESHGIHDGLRDRRTEAGARRPGYDVKPDAIANATAWLRKRWPQMKKEQADLRAYVAAVTRRTISTTCGPRGIHSARTDWRCWGWDSSRPTMRARTRWRPCWRRPHNRQTRRRGGRWIGIR